jgi:hypothetical protein
MKVSPHLYEIQNGQMIISKLKIIYFGKDFHPEFKGYIVEREGGIWIAFIESKQIGKGHFSKLISELKERYDFIKIPTPSKMMIVRALHLGFTLDKEWFGEPFNEWSDMMNWKKEKEHE